MSGINQTIRDKLANELAALKTAQQLGLGNDFTTARIANLEGQVALLDAEIEKEHDDSERKDQNGKAAMAAQYEAEIRHKIDHGFESKEDLFDFARKFKDKDFREQIDALPDEDKKKLAGNVAKQWDEMTPEEKEKFKKDFPEMMKWASEQGYDLDSRDNQKVAALQQEFAKAGNQEGVEAAGRLMVANERYAELVDNQAPATPPTVERYQGMVEVFSARQNLNLVTLANNRAAIQSSVPEDIAMEEALFSSADIPKSEIDQNAKGAIAANELNSQNQQILRGGV